MAIFSGRAHKVCEKGAKTQMADGNPPKLGKNMRSFAIVDLAGCIDENQIQAMARTLARVLVRQAIAEHGINTSEEND